MSAALRKVKSDQKDVSLKRVLQDKRKRMRLFLLVSGILLLVWGFSLSNSSVPRDSQPKLNSSISGEVSSFSQEPIQVDKALLGGQNNKVKLKSPPIRIIIPDLDIDLPVKEAKVINGFWEVFADSAGFGVGSSYPEDVGNQVIFAHARKGLFLPLKDTKAGQMIYILTKNSWFSYKIEAIKEVLPNQLEVIAPTNEAVLTLYTCSGFADSKRFIVIAKRS